MGRRGPKPGEPRRGGRKKGTPNKATFAREMTIRELRELQGSKLAKDVMAITMGHFLKLAEQYAPASASPDEGNFVKYLTLASGIAKDLAPYESPRMQSTVIRGDDKPIAHSLTVKFV